MLVSAAAAFHLSAPEPSQVVPLSAEPPHDAQTLLDDAQLVMREQQVGRHLNVCGARLP